MLTQQYIKDLSFVDEAATILDDAAGLLFQEQKDILNTYYNRHTGILSQFLSEKHHSISKSSDGISMNIDYMAQIRFMDLKKTASGRKKKIYAPIYNKPVYGYLLGYAYNRLRLGLSTYLRSKTVQKIDEKIIFEIPL